MAPPHDLALCELLHQALKVGGHKLRLVLLNVILPQLIDLVDGPRPEVDPPTPDKQSGANPETQIRMELSYDRAYFEGQGSTQCLPSSGLDGEVEECV